MADGGFDANVDKGCDGGFDGSCDGGFDTSCDGVDGCCGVATLLCDAVCRSDAASPMKKRALAEVQEALKVPNAKRQRKMPLFGGADGSDKGREAVASAKRGLLQGRLDAILEAALKEDGLKVGGKRLLATMLLQRNQALPEQMFAQVNGDWTATLRGFCFFGLLNVSFMFAILPIPVTFPIARKVLLDLEHYYPHLHEGTEGLEALIFSRLAAFVPGVFLQAVLWETLLEEGRLAESFLKYLQKHILHKVAIGGSEVWVPMFGVMSEARGSLPDFLAVTLWLARVARKAVTSTFTGTLRRDSDEADIATSKSPKFRNYSQKCNLMIS